jgi:hypothetical protein
MDCFITRIAAGLLAVCVTAVISVEVNATVMPPNPGMVGGQAGELGMFHGEISINDADEVIVHLSPGMAPAGNTPILPLKFLDASHPDYTDESGAGGPDWTVLNGKYINAQLGWMAANAGGWTLPSGLAVWIKTLSVAGPGVLEVYEGGQGATSVVLPMTSHTFDTILGVGQAWKWFDPDVIANNTTPPFPAGGSGIMVHNWYATTVPGHYVAEYQVYVGDATTGAINIAYAPANVSVSWVPEPAAAAMLSLGVLGILRRRVQTA